MRPYKDPIFNSHAMKNRNVVLNLHSTANLNACINQGNAAQLLGLKLQDTLLIEFGR